MSPNKNKTPPLDPPCVRFLAGLVAWQTGNAVRLRQVETRRGLDRNRFRLQAIDQHEIKALRTYCLPTSPHSPLLLAPDIDLTQTAEIDR